MRGLKEKEEVTKQLCSLKSGMRLLAWTNKKGYIATVILPLLADSRVAKDFLARSCPATPGFYLEF